MLNHYKSACRYIASVDNKTLVLLVLRDILLTGLTGLLMVLGLKFMQILPSAKVGAAVIAVLIALNLAHMVLTYALGKRWLKQCGAL